MSVLRVGGSSVHYNLESGATNSDWIDKFGVIWVGASTGCGAGDLSSGQISIPLGRGFVGGLCKLRMHFNSEPTLYVDNML